MVCDWWKGGKTKKCELRWKGKDDWPQLLEMYNRLTSDTADSCDKQNT